MTYTNSRKKLDNELADWYNHFSKSKYIFINALREMLLATKPKVKSDKEKDVERSGWFICNQCGVNFYVDHEITESGALCDNCFGRLVRETHPTPPVEPKVKSNHYNDADEGGRKECKCVDCYNEKVLKAVIDGAIKASEKLLSLKKKECKHNICEICGFTYPSHQLWCQNSCMNKIKPTPSPKPKKPKTEAYISGETVRGLLERFSGGKAIGLVALKVKILP